MLAELNSHCSLSSHFDLLTTINFSKVPFRCFGVWGKDEDKKGFCHLRSMSGIMNLAEHNLAFPFHLGYQEPHNLPHLPCLFFFFFFKELLESISCVIDNGLVLRIQNWTWQTQCLYLRSVCLLGEIHINRATKQCGKGIIHYTMTRLRKMKVTDFGSWGSSKEVLIFGWSLDVWVGRKGKGCDLRKKHQSMWSQGGRWEWASWSKGILGKNVSQRELI